MYEYMCVVLHKALSSLTSVTWLISLDLLDFNLASQMDDDFDENFT